MGETSRHTVTNESYVNSCLYEIQLFFVFLFSLMFISVARTFIISFVDFSEVYRLALTEERRRSETRSHELKRS